MKIKKIMDLSRKARKEAERETNKIFKKYSLLIQEEIRRQLPKGHVLLSGNGITSLINEEGEEVSNGNWWSKTGNGNPKMEKLAGLQYRVQIDGNFLIDSKIKNE